MQFSIVITSLCDGSNFCKTSPTLAILLWIVAFAVDMKWYLMGVLTCISLKLMMLSFLYFLTDSNNI